MSRHSRNNTAGAVFTYAERQKLEYGTQELRLGRDSMKNYDVCHICLQPAREPVVCEEGHLTCRECIYEAILTQKNKNSQKMKDYKSELAKRDEEEKQKVVMEKQRIVTDFLRQQVSAAPPPSIPATDAEPARKKGKLPSFWIPSQTPAAKEPLKPPTLKTVCPVTNHPISIKKLYPVKYFDSKEDQRHSCPICLKVLSNSVKIVVLLSCGHVICSPCLDNFVTDSELCTVCSKPFDRKADLIPLHSEGTGYAAGGGKVLVRKFDVAFS